MSQVAARSCDVTWFQSDQTTHTSDDRTVFYPGTTGAHQGWFGGDGVVRWDHFTKTTEAFVVARGDRSVRLRAPCAQRFGLEGPSATT
jgi:hypothetical protein